MKFSSKQRKDVLNGVNKQELDVIVIGGGITGSGIALDGATRGLSTIVFEMQDFARQVHQVVQRSLYTVVYVI